MADDLSHALEPPRMTILSDHPILRVGEEEAVRESDSFALHSRLGAIYDIIRHRNTRAPLAIAIYGDWGTGKSSAMRWLSDQLGEWSESSNKAKRGKHFRVRTVWFDPWKYTKREDVWRGLVSEVILKAIDVDGASLHTVVHAARQFGLFLGRSFLNILTSTKLKVGDKKLGAEAEIDLDALSKIAEDYRQTSHPEKAFLNEFESALRDWVKASLADDERMVIFIDDLDRCLPEVVLEVLEALKLYLNIPQLIFVVGLDREVVDAVVKHHYKQNGLGESKAERYLDKMFQVEVEVPPSQRQMEDYLPRQIKAMDKVADGYWSTNLSGWEADYQQIIEAKIGTLAEDNPREIKRLLNSTLLRATAAALDGKLTGSEAQRFTQGCQVYLMQRVLRKYVEQSANWLREREPLAFFTKWSQFREAYPGFRPSEGLTARDPEDAEKDPSRAAKKEDEQTQAAYKTLRSSLPRYRDRDEAYPLLGQPDLWHLLAIPFSEDVAAAAVTERPEADDIDRSGEDAGVTETEPLVETASKDVGKKRVPSPASVALNDMPRSLRSAIARTLDKPVAKLEPEDLQQVWNLDLSNSELDDLTPLKGLSGLQILSLDGTQVSDLTPLKGLSELQNLNLDNTQVSDLTPLKGLSGLQRLTLNDTQVSDLTPLKGLSGLQKLYLDGTQVFDLTPLKGLSGLQRLWLDRTQVSDLTPVKGLSGLQRLTLNGTPVSDLTPLKRLSGLHTLYLNNTQVSDLTPLKGSSGLQKLYLDGTQVFDLTPLKGLSGLQRLWLDRTQVSDLTPLKGLSGLQRLTLYDTQVSDLTPLKGLSRLQKLDLNNTQVSDLTPLKGLSRLHTLSLNNTQVSDLTPVKHVPNVHGP